MLIAVLIIVAAIVIARQISRRYRGTKRKKLLQENPAIVRVLLSLEPEALDELFKLYRREFGAGAARYARHTYRKWKTQEVHPSRKTFRRLAFHLPSVMNFDLKCEVLRALRKEYCGKSQYELSVGFEDWNHQSEISYADGDCGCHRNPSLSPGHRFDYEPPLSK